MKINIKAKDFHDKEKLQKTLDTKLKKPLMALRAKLVPELPFILEANHFEDGSGFIAIGECKEIHNIYKKERVKGNFKDPKTKKTEKVDKKNIAMGKAMYNKDGVLELHIEAGKMDKKMLAKTTIKSIAYLKKEIGDNFVIIKGGKPMVEVEEGKDESAPSSKEKETTKENGPDPKAQKERRVKLKKIKENVVKLGQLKGKMAVAKVLENIEKFEKALKVIKEEALANDGKIDVKEQAFITNLTSDINALRDNLGGQTKGKLTEEKRAKIKENMSTINKRLEKISKELGL